MVVGARALWFCSQGWLRGARFSWEFGLRNQTPGSERAPRRVKAPRGGSPVAQDMRRSYEDEGGGKLGTDEVARLLEIVAQNPDDAIRRLAKAEGFPHHATEKFLKRLRVTHANFKEAVQRLGRRELVEKLDEKIALGLHYLDDFSMSGMDGKDLAIMLGILIEKKQLMEGRPTAILSFEERRNLSELLPAFVREAQRRGITIDQTAVEVVEVPRPMTMLPDEILEINVSHTARKPVVKNAPTESQ